MSARTRAAHRLLRARVDFVDADRCLDADVRAAAELIRSGALSRVAQLHQAAGPG